MQQRSKMLTPNKSSRKESEITTKNLVKIRRKRRHKNHSYNPKNYFGNY